MRLRLALRNQNPKAANSECPSLPFSKCLDKACVNFSDILENGNRGTVDIIVPNCLQKVRQFPSSSCYFTVTFECTTSPQFSHRDSTKYFKILSKAPTGTIIFTQNTPKIFGKQGLSWVALG